MNTLFEIILAEPDENQIAAAEAALDEVQRLEMVMSRFDPASELTRVNQMAAQCPVLISYEMMEILNHCQRFWGETGGYFDPVATSARGKNFDFRAVCLDEMSRTVSFTMAEAKLDFGGFGKGFALDAAAAILKENGIHQALLHGGTSSVLAMGCSLEGRPWKIGIRHPNDKSKEITQLELTNDGLSTSAVFHHSQTLSDIVNPLEHGELMEQACCSVVAQNALDAEVFSTAFLSMGQRSTKEWLERNPQRSLRVLWMERDDFNKAATANFNRAGFSKS